MLQTSEDAAPRRHRWTVHVTLGNSNLYDQPMFSVECPPLMDQCRRLRLLGATVTRNPATAAADTLDFELLWLHVDEPTIDRGATYSNVQTGAGTVMRRDRNVTCLLGRRNNDSLANFYAARYDPIVGDGDGAQTIWALEYPGAVGKMRVSWGSATNDLVPSSHVQTVVLHFECEG